MKGPNDTKVYTGDIPMPESISWMLLALNTGHEIATGYNTKTQRLEYFYCPKDRAEAVERSLNQLYRTSHEDPK